MQQQELVTRYGGGPGECRVHLNGPKSGKIRQCHSLTGRKCGSALMDLVAIGSFHVEPQELRHAWSVTVWCGNADRRDSGFLPGGNLPVRRAAPVLRIQAVGNISEFRKDPERTGENSSAVDVKLFQSLS